MYLETVQPFLLSASDLNSPYSKAILTQVMVDKFHSPGSVEKLLLKLKKSKFPLCFYDFIQISMLISYPLSVLFLFDYSCVFILCYYLIAKLIL